MKRKAFLYNKVQYLIESIYGNNKNIGINLKLDFILEL